MTTRWRALKTVAVVLCAAPVAVHRARYTQNFLPVRTGSSEDLQKTRTRQHRGLDQLSKAAPSSRAFLRLVADKGGNLGTTAARLLHLLRQAGAAELEEALVEVLEHDAIHLGAVRQVLDRRRSERGAPPPLAIPIAHEAHRHLVVTPHSLATYDVLKKESPT